MTLNMFKKSIIIMLNVFENMLVFKMVSQSSDFIKSMKSSVDCNKSITDKYFETPKSLFVKYFKFLQEF